MAILTFLDSNVLIAAHRGTPAKREPSLAILNDSGRSFIASPFVYLETLPKAIYLRNGPEIKFYRTYFDNVRIWINDVESIVRIAREESERCGIAAMDARTWPRLTLVKRRLCIPWNAKRNQSTGRLWCG